MIHHVLLACPRGSEELSRAFYVGLLGLTEKPNPPALAARLDTAGQPVTWGDEEIPGMRRFHTHDPHGNRLEFLAPVTTG